MCCVCVGVCNHVGPHSYCMAHGGSPSTAPMWTGQNTALPPAPAYGFRFVPSVCEHCFCKIVSDYAVPVQPDPHEECCNCGVRRKADA